MTLYEFDLAVAKARDAHILCGVDEAGRGPLAGPVFAAAVVLPERAEELLPGLNDSKKLTARRREKLYDEILARATASCIASANCAEIESLNILRASLLAMRRAVQGLAVMPSLVLVDGISDPSCGAATELLVKGDSVSACIAAASILAKVARDRYMQELDQQYPEYAFAKHKGYGTRLHYERLDQFGPCPAHRKMFLRKWALSREAEQLVFG